jgi:hypothetical protein
MAYNQQVMGSNPGTVYWMDIRDATYYINIHKNNEKKVSQWGTPKIIFFKYCFKQVERKLDYVATYKIF